MKDNPKCDIHDQEIIKINTEFGAFKRDISKKIDDIIAWQKKPKPLLSDKQILSIIITVVVYLIISVNYVGTTDARSIQNYNDIRDSKKADGKMMDLLIEIKSIVDKNEGRKEAEKN